MSRRLPSTREAAEILARKRTRPPHRAAPTAGRSLARFIKELDARFGQGTGALTARWREIVGADLARGTEPIKLTKPRAGGGSTLELRVDSFAALRIQHQSDEILARVNLFLGQGSVEKLRIVQGLVKPKATAPAPAAPKRKPPLDAAREAELGASLEPVPDGELKSALQRLGRGALRGDDRRR